MGGSQLKFPSTFVDISDGFFIFRICLGFIMNFRLLIFGIWLRFVLDFGFLDFVLDF